MKRDQGFSVAELVVAVAILFFVLTALFGLVGATTGLSASAKQRALAVDAGGSFVEDVRTMPYEQVGVVGAPSSEPTGTLTVKTVNRNNMSITITPNVTWVDDTELPGDKNYKKVVLTVVVTRLAGNPYTYTVTTYVRNRSTNPGMVVGGASDDPTIAFADYVPPDGSVIYGQSVLVGATAGHEAADGVLTIMRIIGGNGLVRSTDGGRAEWAVNAHTFTSTPNPFIWDTTLSYEDTSSGSPVTVYYYPDGPITLVAEILDTQNHRAFVTRNYIVDNDPPDAPTNPAIATPTPPTTPLRMSWTPGADGSTPAPSHRVVVYTQDNANTDPTEWGAQSPVVVTTPEGDPSTVAYDHPGAAPFSRYVFSVVALSARGTPSLQTVSPPFTTRPVLTGVASTSGSSATHELAVTAPTFPCVGDVTYDWYVSVNGGSWANVVAQDPTSATLERTGLNKNSTYRYRVAVNYTPTGPASTSTFAYSQIAGQTNKGQSNFTAVNDWTKWW